MIDPERIDMEWYDYIVKLIRYRLRRIEDQQVGEIHAQVMGRLKRMARKQMNIRMIHGEASLKALLAQAVRWSVVDWLRYVNAKKRRPEAAQRADVPVERIGAEDPGIEALIWPGAGKTVWAIGGINIREVFGQDLERIPHRALLRAVTWGLSYNDIQRRFNVTRNQLRGRVYRGRQKANKLWQRALARREARWEEERREDRKNSRVGGFRGGRHHQRHKF